MATEYKLSYTANEIDKKLSDIENKATFTYVDSAIEGVENGLIERINDIDNTLTQTSEKANSLEETVNNNASEIESLQEQHLGLEEHIDTELAKIPTKISQLENDSGFITALTDADKEEIAGLVYGMIEDGDEVAY